MSPESTDERRLIVDKLVGLLRVEADRLELHEELHRHHPADIAEALDGVSEDVRHTILDSLDAERRGEVLDEADDMDVEVYVEERPVEDLAQLIDALPPDEAADMLNHVDDDKAEQVMAQLEPGHAEEVRELREYPSDTAGGIMTTEFFAVQPRDPVSDILARIKTEYDEVETVSRIFVLNDAGKLKGRIAVEDLLSAEPETLARDVMDAAVISIGPLADQEIAARYMQKYDLTVMPVVDPGRRLLGIITVDDILEVLSDEVSEDMYRMAGVGAIKPLEQPALERAYQRLPWLLTTIVGMGIVAPFLLEYLFADTLKSIVVLALFIPAIMGLGGNAATQSATITVRGLATGELTFSDWAWMLRREVSVGLIIALVCSVIVGGVAAGLLSLGLDRGVSRAGPSVTAAESVVAPQAAASHSTSPVRFGITVGGALFFGIVLSVVVGTSIPILCDRFGVDPAVAAGPFITTLIDIGTQTLYLALASLLLMP